jgi:hypothetical protein
MTAREERFAKVQQLGEALTDRRDVIRSNIIRH